MHYDEKPKNVRFYETWTFVVIICIILPVCFRAFLYSPRHIPSSSMKPNLLIGDYLFISKFEYGFSRYSFPLGYKVKYFEGRVSGDKPERGDVIVFRPPHDPETDYIKRLVGMPGDKVQMKKGKLYLNGQKLQVKRVHNFVDEDQEGNNKEIERYIEYLPNGPSYYILDDEKNSIGDDTGVYLVPENHYFMMGDNRDNSADSRFMVGYVPEENLIGKAEVIFFSNKSSFLKIWEWVFSFRENRFLKDIDEKIE